MCSKGSRFTLGVWGLRVCSLDVAFVVATVRNRPQASATVRNRSYELCMAVPMGSSAEVVIFGGFQCVVASFRVAGVALRYIPGEPFGHEKCVHAALVHEKTCSQPNARFTAKWFSMFVFMFFTCFHGHSTLFHGQMHTFSRPNLFFTATYFFHGHTRFSWPFGQTAFGFLFCDQKVPQVQTCSATCRKSFCVAGAILLRRFQKMCCSFRGRRSTLDMSIVIFRGKRSTLDVSRCVFFANRIGRAALGVAFCDMCWKLTEASHETSILR